MKLNVKNLGLDDVALEIDSTPTTVDELAEETKEQVDKLHKEAEKIEEVTEDEKDAPRLDLVDVMGSEERNAKALDILEKERMLQVERENEWKKEKKSKRMKRFIKTSILVFVVAVLFLAWYSGYRIPIPDEWVVHIQGIYQSAYDAVTGYFTGN
ncbi:hypothetical protein [Flavonifractor sp. An91]|uniref:hypothetical protein n=1 Tax=Flavonifractor sp. An91 TaxID=1965665 RepID=UPI000B36713D|nr:hypothetical protein [Flavonifractor sp. An91]OUN13331.1 hypothetical protein B5G42_04925 [Flavonifractor sp. An91]